MENNMSIAGLEEIKNIVGAEFMVTDPQQLALMSKDIIPYTQQASAFVWPKSVEEIQAILKVANQQKLAIWTCSRGKNWGYGGASPSQAGEVVLILDRMNQVLEVNEELAYAVVEPGVSFRQLHEYIKSRNIPLWLDCTDGPADASVIGNSVERGIGETNYGDHFGNVCGLEVILPTGELVRTGGGPMKNYASWNTYKWGVGPYLEGLFTQSNFGIVTKMGVWLMPQPECCETVFFEAKSEDVFPAVIDEIRKLQLSGTLISKIHMINKTVQLSILGPEAEKLSRRFDISPWVFAAGIYGSASQVRANKEHISKALSGYGKFVFINQPQVRFLEKILSWGGYYKSQKKPKLWLRSILELVAGKPMQLIEMIPNIASIERGEPSDYFVKHAYRKSPVTRPPDHDIDPARDNCGMVWLGPMVPLVGKQVQDFLNSCWKIFDQHNTERYVALMVANPRTVIALFAVYFTKSNPQEVENAQKLYIALGEHTQKMGYQQYRTSTAYMDKVLDPAPEFRALSKKIKQALDPNNVLSPGKYGV
ncbi:MAG: FAD-binding oxidoreductase [Candidatus Omnitrophica bacterium]|nr:FAD-binding oxidoreductase [Candidatus Omnitrophota bacterium]